MKRSEINTIIKEGEAFFTKQNFLLPPFASWTLEDWKKNKDTCTEILDCYLGWDLTDFGRGDYAKEGLFLFTVRNGILGSKQYPKQYAEKIMISKEGQLTLMHYHAYKTEDIINRGGGKLSFHLFNSTKDGEKADTPVSFAQDGISRTVPAGSKITLEPGESITLTQGMYHEFWAEKGYGDVMIGEVSAVNDDHNDNYWYEKDSRFPTIEEDEAPYRYLVSDYDTLLKPNL